VRSEPREAAGASEADAASTSVRAAASERLILKPPYIAAGVFYFMRGWSTFSFVSFARGTIPNIQLRQT
jgi:hypothetical protein